MNPTLRSVLAVIFGILLAGLGVAGIETLGHVVYPPPEGLSPSDYEAIKTYVATAPVGALLFVLLAWGVGTFAGAWFAAWFAGRAPVTHGLIVGLFPLAGGIAQLVLLPHPVWFAVVGVAIFPLAAYLGARLAGKPSATT